MFSPINSAIARLVKIVRNQPVAEKFNPIIPTAEEFAMSIANLTEMIDVEPAPFKQATLPVGAIRKPGTQSWRPALNAIDIVMADLDVREAKMVRIFASTRKVVGQYKITAREEWDFVQAGRALAQYEYWTLDHSFTQDNVTWNVMQHRFEKKQIAVCIDGSNFITMTKGENNRWSVHPLVAPGLHITRIDGMFWVFGDTQKHSSKLAQAGGMFSRVSPVGMPAWAFEAVPSEITAIASPNRASKYHLLAAMLLGDRVVVERAGFSKLAGEVAVLDGYRRELFRIAGYDYRDYPRPVFGLPCPACGEVKNGFVRDICVDCDAEMSAHLETQNAAF